MRISHKYKFVFIAIPRTGSTSLRDTLESVSDISSTYKYNISEDNPFYHHISAREIRDIFSKKGWDWSEYTKFCVVRNPYDRAVSLYHHRINTKLRVAPGKLWIYNFLRKARYMCYRKTFTQWVMSKESQTGLCRSAFDFTHDENGDCLINIFLRFEDLDSEFESLAESLGISGHVSDVSKLNVTPKRKQNYQNYYDNNSMQLVTERYKFEIETFNYEF